MKCHVVMKPVRLCHHGIEAWVLQLCLQTLPSSAAQLLQVLTALAAGEKGARSMYMQVSCSCLIDHFAVVGSFFLPCHYGGQFLHFLLVNFAHLCIW